jgi:Uma2 family endonuclease
MLEAGVLDPDRKYELIDGELFDMASEGEPHINYKAELTEFFIRRITDRFRVVPDSTLHLSPVDAPSPDLYIHERGAPLRPIDPDKIALIVEIADTSLERDLGAKASLYARFDVAEYWVLDLAAWATFVHREPLRGAYPAPERVPFDQLLQPVRLSGVELRLESFTFNG